MLVSTTTYGEGDKDWAAPTPIRRPPSAGGESEKALSQRPTRTTEPGSRDDPSDIGRHLAPGATHLPGDAPVIAAIA